MLTYSRLYLRTDRSLRKLKANEKITELEQIAANSIKAATTEAAKFSKIPERNLGVVVRARERKSVEVIVIIGTSALAMCNAVSKYPDFRNGLLVLIRDARKAAEWIREEILGQNYADGRKESTRITTSPMTQLMGIRRRLEEGEMSRSEALEKARGVFLRAGEHLPAKVSRFLEDFLATVSTPRKKLKTEPRTRRAVVRAKKRVKRSYGPGVEMEKHPGSQEIITHYLS